MDKTQQILQIFFLFFKLLFVIVLNMNINTDNALHINKQSIYFFKVTILSFNSLTTHHFEINSKM